MGIDPGTLQMISMGANVAGAVMGAFGSSAQGRAASDAAAYQAAVARNNQTIAEQNAQLAEQKGRQEEAAKREQTAQMMGSLRARAAGSGVDVNSGSPLNLQEDVARLGELDALTIRNNAARSAYGYRTQGADFGAQAGLLDVQAQNARKAGNIGAFSSIIGGASGVADKWLKFKYPTMSSSS